MVKVQQARNELSFFRQKVGLVSTEELCSPLLAKDKKEKKGSKRDATLSQINELNVRPSVAEVNFEPKQT